MYNSSTLMCFHLDSNASKILIEQQKALCFLWYAEIKSIVSVQQLFWKLTQHKMHLMTKLFTPSTTGFEIQKTCLEDFHQTSQEYVKTKSSRATL